MKRKPNLYDLLIAISLGNPLACGIFVVVLWIIFSSIFFLIKGIVTLWLSSIGLR